MAYPPDRATFADLITAEYSAAFRLGLALLHDQGAAEDAVQEADSQIELAGGVLDLIRTHRDLYANQGLGDTTRLQAGHILAAPSRRARPKRS